MRQNEVELVGIDHVLRAHIGDAACQHDGKQEGDIELDQFAHGTRSATGTVQEGSFRHIALRLPVTTNS